MVKKESDLARWRKEKKISREKLGRMLGLSSYTIWKAEHGHPIGTGTAAILSKATGWEMSRFALLPGAVDVRKM